MSYPSISIQDFATEYYGKAPLNQSQSRPRRPRAQIAALTPAMDGQVVLLRSRVQTSRAQGSKMVFFNLRQRTDSVQALLTVSPGKVSKQMAKWAAGLQTESIVLVEGTVKKAPEIIKSATVGDIEIHISQIHLISGLEGVLPFSVEDANRPETEVDSEDAQFKRVLLDTRLNNRVVDLRTQTNQAVFKLQHAISHLFRDYLDSQGFTEIHSPKLQGAATESGASVFKVNYFKGDAYLAQSPQLAKQMAIAADFERVYEIGPVFRAEDSNTHRHMTEFTGLDLEMAIEEHYHEVLELLDGLFLHMFRSLRQKYSGEIETVRRQFPAEEFKWREGPEGTLKLSFREAVDLLVEDGVPREVLDDIKWVIAVAFHIIVNNSSDIAQKMRSGLVELFGLSMIPTISSSTSSLWSFGPSTQCRTRKTLHFRIHTISSCVEKRFSLARNVFTIRSFLQRRCALRVSTPGR
ncbi:hypothetical protein AcW1_000562 [Taiwanofungus camphoratus]|nr:hypothetical protein AcW1_000562 [Antrodia cinnamomea]